MFNDHKKNKNDNDILYFIRISAQPRISAHLV